MLSAHHINKTYGIHTVLQDITFSINPGGRFGLIVPLPPRWKLPSWNSVIRVKQTKKSPTL